MQRSTHLPSLINDFDQVNNAFASCEKLTVLRTPNDTLDSIIVLAQYLDKTSIKIPPLQLALAPVLSNVSQISRYGCRPTFESVYPIQQRILHWL